MQFIVARTTSARCNKSWNMCLMVSKDIHTTHPKHHGRVCLHSSQQIANYLVWSILGSESLVGAALDLITLAFVLRATRSYKTNVQIHQCCYFCGMKLLRVAARIAASKTWSFERLMQSTLSCQ